jgi:hypothetical protein
LNSSRIDPFIYERISLLRSHNDARSVQNFLATIKTRPANFFAAHVKYLYFDHTVPLSAVWRILSVRTGVVSVGCHHPYLSLAPQLAPLSLQRLCVSEFKLPPTPADLPHWAASLTPLGLTQRLPRNPATALAALPALTHLATDYRAIGLGDNKDIPVRLFSVSPHLRCLILMTGSTPAHALVFLSGRTVPHPPAAHAGRDVGRRVLDVFVETLERRHVEETVRAEP